MEPIAAVAPRERGRTNVQTTTRFNGNIVRVGLNYKFDWGVPAITK
jgi:hypothetical protein